MIRNSKTEKAHRVLRDFITPKLRPGFAFDATPFFFGIDDRNIADKIDDIVGAVARATSGDLVYDASTPELRRKLEAAVKEPDGTPTKEAPSEVDENIINRVLMLLEARLTPSELLAVKAILTQASKKQRGIVRGPEEIGEDARLAYDQRFPDAARLRVEPSCAPAPQRQAAAPDLSGYAARFPDAMRIGQA